MKKFKIKFLLFTIIFSVVSIFLIYLLYKAQMNSLKKRLHEEYKQVYIEDKKYHVKDIVINIINNIRKERIIARNKFRYKLSDLFEIALFTLKKSKAESVDEIKSIFLKLSTYNYDLIGCGFFVMKDGKFLMKPFVNLSEDKFKRIIKSPDSYKDFFVLKKKYKGFVVGIFGDYREVERSVKDNIIASLAGFRYETDNSGYIVILEILKEGNNQIKTVLLLNPNKPDSVGRLVPMDLEDVYGKKFHKEIVEKCLKQGEGYVSYHFKIPDTDKIGEKITYVKLYKDWNWIIGTGFYLDMFKQHLFEKDLLLKKIILSYNIKFALFLFLSFGVLVLIFIVFISKNMKEMNLYVKKIKENEKFKEILLNLTPNPLFVVDKNGNFIDINRSFETFFGVSKTNLLNNTCKHTDKIEELKKVIKRDLLVKENLKSGITKKETSILVLNKMNKVLEVHKSFLFFDDEFIGMIGILFDITEQQKLTNKLYNQTIKDELTKAYNRRHLRQVFVKEKEKMIMYDTKMSVIMFDLDFFKKVNDTYGHQVGDKVLKEVVKIVKSNIRSTDYLFRIGGEEFLILLPGTDKFIAYKIAEKLRKLVSEYKFEEGFSITISLGVTEVQVSDSLDDAVKRADEALYMSKKSGRNKTTIF